MRIPLERSGATPLYAQIEGFVRRAIGAGTLAANTRIPSARRLAGDLGISRMTVETAYARLEADGLLRRETGSGTFVMRQRPGGDPASAPAPAAWPRWQRDLASRALDWHRAPVAAAPVGAVAQIDFAAGGGDPRRFPLADLRSELRAVLQRDGRQALHYGDARGYEPLRRSVAELLSVHGLQAAADEVLITSGSQQGIALVAQLLLRPGDTVLVERPTYAAALDLFRALGVRIVDVPLDHQGMQVELLEPLLTRWQPKLIYTVPTFQNPSGSCMGSAQRRALVALAARHDVAVLEDDFVGDLRYEGNAQPPLKALDRSGNVIYVSTFSKMLTPGLRVGFVHAGGPVLELLAGLKRLTDLATSNLLQRALHRHVSIGRYEAHLRRSRRLYLRRRDAMARAVECCFPPGSSFALPAGGLFLWVGLPDGCSSSALLPLAIRAGISFAPGSEFFLDAPAGDRFLRLNFAAFTPEEIDCGIRELGRVMVAASRA
jgi:GntR family transcriptional regulator / MocR family aminotransferase